MGAEEQNRKVIVWKMHHCGKVGKRFISRDLNGKQRFVGLCYACSMRLIMLATRKLTQEQWNEVDSMLEGTIARLHKTRLNRY